MAKVKLKFKRERFHPLPHSMWKVIEKIVDNGHKGKHCLPTVVNGVLKITRTGSQWRNLEEKPTFYPAWESLYYGPKRRLSSGPPLESGKKRAYGENF